MPRTERQATLLPQCNGPKLHPFVDDKASLEFIRLLSDPLIDRHACVFEVSIGGQSFALKVARLRVSSSPDYCKMIINPNPSSVSTMIKRTRRGWMDFRALWTTSIITLIPSTMNVEPMESS